MATGFLSALVTWFVLFGFCIVVTMACAAAALGTMATAATAPAAPFYLVYNPTYHADGGSCQYQYNDDKLCHSSNVPIWNNNVDAIHANPMV